MRRLLAAVLLVLPLSGCIDAEMTFDFKNDSTVEFYSKTLIGQDMAMMSGIPESRMCSGKPAQAHGSGLKCEETKTLTIEQLQAELAKEDDNNPLSELQKAIKVERPDDKTIKVTLDFGASEQLVDDETKMMARMLVGQGDQNKVALTVKGPKILETTGTLSEDGTSAHFEVPVMDVMMGDIPPPFVTTIELKSCTFRIFC